MLAYETEALATEAKAFSVETEAKTKMFSLEAEATSLILATDTASHTSRTLMKTSSGMQYSF